MRVYGSMERKEVLLMAFMGQSNMAGRGNGAVYPCVLSGVRAWEVLSDTNRKPSGR